VFNLDRGSTVKTPFPQEISTVPDSVQPACELGCLPLPVAFVREMYPIETGLPRPFLGHQELFSEVIARDALSLRCSRC
jgi:hypothetical protein